MRTRWLDIFGRYLHAVAGAALCAAILLSLTLLAGCTRQPTAELSFNDTIQPILSENCYHCHGPDKSSRKAGLRLDRAEFAQAPHEKFAPAIVPGKPDRSPLIQRIEASNPQERMPPPEAHKTLKPEQVAALRQWIEEGAKYEPHWAFIAPTRPAAPRSFSHAHQGWARHDIDRFILEKLEKEKLAPSPEADKRTLIRRVTHDLTGLPPSVEEVDAFIADTRPDAYEKLVDRLLTSPRYGEHRAHYWLDYVRYGDTHGIHLDNYRAIWPYRDYVIKAYNDNKPFDDFVREQLAGDLLPEQTVETLIATGYMRANPTTSESGTILEEVFVNLTRDRVETFGVTFLGLTTGCAAFLDHKFDPTSQKDFYQLAALLSNTADAPKDFNAPDPPPVLRLPDAKDRAAYEDLLAQRAKLLSQLAARRREAPGLLTAQQSAGQGSKRVSTQALELRLRFDEGQGSLIKNTAPQAKAGPFKTEGNAILWGETQWLWPSARFDSGTRLPLGTVGDVEADERFSVGGWFMPRSLIGTGGAVFARQGDPKGAHGRGWSIFYQYGPRKITNSFPDGRFFFNLINDPNPRAQSKASSEPAPLTHAIQVRTRDTVRSEEWTHLFVTYDGSRKAAGVRVYLNGKPVAVDIINDTLRREDSIRTAAVTHLGRRDDDEPLRETRYQDVRFYRRGLSVEEVARLPFEDVAAEIVAREANPAKWTEDESFVVLNRYWLGEHDPQAMQLASQIKILQTKLDLLVPAPKRGTTPDDNAVMVARSKKSAGEILRNLIDERPSSLIAQEKATPAFAHILKRGAYGSRLERVGPATPHFLPPLAAGVAPDRLALANWLSSPQHPLFARVAVNRMWQELYGTGLVESAGDFGLMGDRPSHPKLLDWLAVELRESGWNVKHLYKQLVMSATYRQSARVTPELQRIDPANRLLARGPRFRMDAEGVRDSALAVSGLLVEKIGGPPVKPYQPPGLWQEVATVDSNTKEYVQDRGENLYRRSLYSFWKRSSPPPGMETFDAPSRETACPRRARANTPLQSLATLNDPQFVEAARVLAQHALRAATNTEERLDTLARITLSRPLEAEEKSLLEKSRRTFVQRFEAEPRAARALLTVGESRVDLSFDPRELAAWTLIAGQFLNLDEFLTK